MSAGKYRRQVTIQRLQQASDGMGGFQTSWVNVATVWASIQPIVSKHSIDERFIASQLEANTFYIVETRYRSDVDASMRMTYGSKLFNIRTVTDVDERHRELQLICEELQTR